MNGIGAAFFALGGLLVLTLPRRAAVLPLLAGALWMTSGQLLQIGDANFTIPRLLVALGFVRVLLRGERIAGGLQTVDRLVLLWAAVLLGTSAWHTSDAWLYRAGIVWTEVGCYFLFRIFLRDLGDLRRAAQAVCLFAVPVAVSMAIEKSSGQNAFGWLGGVNLQALVRDGHVRASGPFAHPILAGTVGATCIALGLSIRRFAPASAALGIAAGTAIVFAATSSGPILMVATVLLGRWFWHLRDHMGAVRKATVAVLLGLSAVMNDPVYFLMARIDLSGGSQGYFRAQLIRSSIEHLSEWWLVGTDYTRHWMASGVYANARHTDITNHYLAMGVMGGLPLMAVFTGIVALAFRDAGRALRLRADVAIDERRFVWALGALLFGFAMSFWSISLFDQSVIFFWLTVAAIQTAACRCQPLETADAAASAPAFGGGALPIGSRLG